MIYLIGDIHLNYRSIFIQQYLDIFNKYYYQTIDNLFDKLSKIKNSTIIFLGDLIEPYPIQFDLHKIIDFYNLLKQLTKHNKVYIIIGNHDIYFKERKSIIYEFHNNLKNLNLIDVEQIYKLNNGITLAGWNTDLNAINSKLIITHNDTNCKNSKIINGHIHNPYNINSKNCFYVGSIFPVNFRDAYQIYSVDELKSILKNPWNYGFAVLKSNKIKRINLKNKLIFVQIFLTQTNYKKFFDFLKKPLSIIIEFNLKQSLFNKIQNHFNDLNQIYRIKFIEEKPKLEITEDFALENKQIKKMMTQIFSDFIDKLKTTKQIKEEILRELL